MITNNSSNPTADHGLDTDCRCPDDRCAGFHHEIGETCWCSIFTGQPAEAQDGGL